MIHVREHSILILKEDKTFNVSCAGAVELESEFDDRLADGGARLPEEGCVTS